MIDRDEVEKFDQVSDHWWDPDGPFRPLHRINPLRLDFIASYADLKKRNILDVGCGGGILSESMACQGASVTGIDASERAIHAARDHAETNKVSIQYEQTDSSAWAEKNAEKYDIITCLEVLEHVPNVPQTIADCCTMLKPDGLFFFATINRTPTAFFKAIVGAEYVLRWLPRGTHQYRKFIRPSELTRAMRQQGLDLKGIKGMDYDLLQDTFMINENLSVNYLGVARKTQSTLE